MLSSRDIRDRIRQGKPTVGTWLQLPSPDVAEIVDGVSKLDRLEFASKAEQQAEIDVERPADGDECHVVHGVT